MGTISEKIIEKLDSLSTKIDEDHQELQIEITTCKEQLEIYSENKCPIRKIGRKSGLYPIFS